jgi:large subunit ribosomal protein L21
MTIDVERLEVADGKTIELDKVLLLSAGETVTVGKPTVEGAKVVATAQGEFKDKKILVANFKNKTHSTLHRQGHRQLHTRLVIDKIVGPGIAEVETAKKPRRRRTTTTKKEVTSDGS